eukprot:TRINITY_DN5814_c0_g1_i6.p1 TRINITY_DN5814_c0_g1~~TRINITY_DN5814_c0_g1_i6.p1  ORF type:complete len:394 (+),score=13.93 TRINITY_DN5814_c0_g1_i6:591-1772(+)
MPFEYMQVRNANEDIAAVLHGGDLVYEIYEENGEKARRYFNRVQGFASRVPYIITPGNHEDYDNYSSLVARMRTPLWEKTQSHYFSYNMGNAHFVMINLDLYLDNKELQGNFEKWVKNDLEEANKESERKLRPWVIVVSHRPIFCSDDASDCEKNQDRFGWLSRMLQDNKVDLFLTAHMHNYERMLPVHANKTQKFERREGDDHYRYIINPTATVHVIEGDAGTDETDSTKNYFKREWSVVKDFTEGYGLVTIYNSTHLRYERFQSDSDTLFDYFYILKNASFQISEGDSSQWALWGLAIGVVIIILSLLVYSMVRKRQEEAKLLLKHQSKPVLFADTKMHQKVAQIYTQQGILFFVISSFHVFDLSYIGDSIVPIRNQTVKKLCLQSTSHPY